MYCIANKRKLVQETRVIVIVNFAEPSEMLVKQLGDHMLISLFEDIVTRSFVVEAGIFGFDPHVVGCAIRARR